jgi:hypothetical protein
LCGVLKNIGIVGISVLIWGTIISGLQIFGYTIASAGLVYYGLGYEGIMMLGAAVKAKWDAPGSVSKGWKTTLAMAAGAIFMFSLIVMWRNAGEAPEFPATP